MAESIIVFEAKRRKDSIEKMYPNFRDLVDDLFEFFQKRYDNYLQSDTLQEVKEEAAQLVFVSETLADDIAVLEEIYSEWPDEFQIIFKDPEDFFELADKLLEQNEKIEVIIKKLQKLED